MCSFCAFVVVEPDGSLKLVSSIQEQHVLLLAADLRHFGESSGHSSEAGTLGRTLPRVHAGLLDPRMVVVGVEQSQLESPHLVSPTVKEQQQQEEQEVDRERAREQSAQTRPHAHGVAVRKDAPEERRLWSA